MQHSQRRCRLVSGTAAHNTSKLVFQMFCKFFHGLCVTNTSNTLTDCLIDRCYTHRHCCAKLAALPLIYHYFIARRLACGRVGFVGGQGRAPPHRPHHKQACLNTRIVQTCEPEASLNFSVSALLSIGDVLQRMTARVDILFNS